MQSAGNLNGLDKFGYNNILTRTVMQNIDNT